MKSVIGIILVVTFAVLCLFGCSNIPKEPATTAVEQYSYVNPSGATLPPAENTEPNSGEQTVKYIETVNNINCVLSNYYVYGNSVASITDIQLEDDGFQINVNGYASIKIDGIGSRKNNMKIGYTAYDSDGNVVRESYLLALLDGVKEGDIVDDCRFDFPREAVKIEFHDYVEK